MFWKILITVIVGLSLMVYAVHVWLEIQAAMKKNQKYGSWIVRHGQKADWLERRK